MQLSGKILIQKLGPTWVAWFEMGSHLSGQGLTEQEAIEDLCRKRIDRYLDHED